jgi:hypothetical protein
MRKLALVLIAVGGLLSASLAYEVPGPDARYHADHYRDGTPDRSQLER